MWIVNTMILTIMLWLYLAIAGFLYLTMCTEMHPDEGNFIVRQLKAIGISLIWLPWLVIALVRQNSF